MIMANSWIGGGNGGAMGGCIQKFKVIQHDQTHSLILSIKVILFVNEGWYQTTCNEIL